METDKLNPYAIPGIKGFHELVAEAFQVTVSEIIAKDRKGPGKEARFFCMWYLKKNTDLSLAKIGKRYKGRDHATVLYACERAEIWKDNDKKFKAKFDKAIELLKNINVS